MENPAGSQSFLPLNILLATRNPHKIREIRAILPKMPEVTWHTADEFHSLTEPDETGETFEENAMIKACHYARVTGFVSLADDSGLEIEALGGRPGIKSARYAESTEARIQKVLNEMESIPAGRRRARFVCAAVLADPAGHYVTRQGVCEGEILFKAAGKGGFGYDPIFGLPSLGKSLAELSSAEKNELSHRSWAMKGLVPVLIEVIRDPTRLGSTA